MNPPLILMEGLQLVLSKLSSKYKLGILGQYGKELLRLLKDHLLLDYFTFQSTQDEFNITKPDPRYFEQILKKAGVAALKSVMIGDRIDKDIIPAKQIGMKTVRIKVGLHKNQKPRTFEEIPDYEYNSVKEMININI